MTTVAEAWAAGIDAVIADNTLNRSGFVDAMQTVITTGLSNSEGNAYVDAVAGVYASLGIINNATYNNLRAEIINEGADVAKNLYEALAANVFSVPEFEPVDEAAKLQDLREERDNADAAVDRLQELIDAEPPGPIARLVRPVLRDGKRLIVERKQAIRDEIRNITGDPDN